MTSGDVTLNSLTLKNGRVANGPGGAIHSTSSGRLTINLSTLADNSTTAYGQGGGAITDMYVGGRPTIVAPVAGSSSSNQTPTFTWRPVDRAARYMLQVDRLDAAQSKVIFKTDLTSTSFTATTALPAGTYRAWVQAVSTTGQFSPWSLQLDFTIGTTTSMIDSPDPDLHLTGLLVSELAQGDARDANGHESQMIDQKQPDPVTDEDDVEVAVPAPSSGPSVWPANNDQQPDLLDLDRWMMEFAVREFLPGQGWASALRAITPRLAPVRLQNSKIVRGQSAPPSSRHKSQNRTRRADALPLALPAGQLPPTLRGGPQ